MIKITARSACLQRAWSDDARMDTIIEKLRSMTVSQRPENHGNLQKFLNQAEPEKTNCRSQLENEPGHTGC